MCKKELDDSNLTALSCRMERRKPLRIGRIHIGLEPQENIDSLFIAVCGSVHQKRQSRLIPFLDICAVLGEQGSDFLAPSLERRLQRCPAGNSLGVWIGAVVQQEPDNLRATPYGCEVERCRPVLVGSVDRS